VRNANAAGVSGPGLPELVKAAAACSLVGLFLLHFDRSFWSEDIQILDNQSDFVTTANAVVCRTPFQLRKAIIAAHADDGFRVRELECKRPGAGIAARVLSRTIPLNGPWQIQLMDKDGLTPVMWGHAQHFERTEPRSSRPARHRLC
jgi:hypothetical protein